MEIKWGLEDGVVEDGGAFGFGDDPFVDEDVDEAGDHAAIDGAAGGSGNTGGGAKDFVSGLAIAGDVGEPFAKRRGLILRNFVESDAHAETDLRVDHGTVSLKGIFALTQNDVDARANGKRNHGVDEAAAGAQVGSASGKFCAGGAVNNFRGSGEKMPRCGAAFIVRGLLLAVEHGTARAEVV
jgi:hypothetical protein